MFDSSVILFWIFSAIIAGAIGHTKGQAAIGVILGGLFPVLGIIFTLFLSNKLQERTHEENFQKSRDLRTRLRLEKIQAQQPVQAPMPRVIVVNAAPQAHVVPPPPGAKVLQNYRIASNGEELGEIALPVIRTMMSAGKLLETDHYFDAPSNEWRTLDQLK